MSARVGKGWRAGAGLATLAVGAGLFAWPSLIGGWVGGGERSTHRVHDISYGALVGILLAAGIAAQIGRPERYGVGLQQAALVAVAYGIAGALARDVAAAGIAGISGVIIAALALFHPARAELLRIGRRLSAPLLLLTVAAAVPSARFAARMASLQRSGSPSDAHVSEHRWLSMAALPIAVVLVGLLASVVRRRRLPALACSATAVVYGAASWAFPTHPGTAGRAWGAAVVAWGVAFAAAAEVAARKPAAPPQPRRALPEPEIPAEYLEGRRRGFRRR